MMNPKTLRKIIKQKGLKKSWIATQLGVSNTMVTRWTTDKNTIPAKRQQALILLLSK